MLVCASATNGEPDIAISRRVTRLRLGTGGQSASAALGVHYNFSNSVQVT